MSLNSAPSPRDVSPERTHANVNKDLTPNSTTPDNPVTREMEGPVKDCRNAVSDSQLPVEAFPEPSTQQENGQESDTRVEGIEPSSKQPLANLSDAATDSLEGPTTDSTPAIETSDVKPPLSTVYIDGREGIAHGPDLTLPEAEVSALQESLAPPRLDTHQDSITHAIPDSLGDAISGSTTGSTPTLEPVEPMPLISTVDTGRKDLITQGCEYNILEAEFGAREDTTAPPQPCVHSVTEAAIQSLELGEGGLSHQGEEESLLKERLRLGVDAPLGFVHAPPEHSDSMIPIPSSSPREDPDQQLTEMDSSPLTSELSIPAPRPAASQHLEILETNGDPSETASLPPRSDSDGTPTPTKVPTQSNTQEDVEMLDLRREIGLGAPFELKASPQVITSSLSSQAIPPSMPRPDYFSEASKPAMPQHPPSSDIPSEIPKEDAERNSALPHMETSDGVIYVPTPGVDPKDSNVFNELDVRAGNSVPEDTRFEPCELATPMAAPLHLETQTGMVTTEEEPVIVDIRTGAPLLRLPVGNEGSADTTLKSRIQMDRLASMLPEPPSSPRSELESDSSEVRTPTRPELLSADSARLLVQNDSHRFDFVDDARSERSVGSSVAPIPPNSPRFITPLLTPSSDPDEFSLYPAGRTSGLSRASSSQPQAKAVVGTPPESREVEQDIAPELTDALNSSFRNEEDLTYKGNVKPAKDAQTGLFTPLAAVNEAGAHTSFPQGTSPRPRQVSSPSTWSIYRSSGWFNSPTEKVPGRPSMEVAEGEFSRPVSRVPRLGDYPPDPRLAGSPTKNNDSTCVIM